MMLIKETLFLVTQSGQAVSQYGVIASDRRERGDLNSATAAVTRDCHVAALLAMTVFRVCMVSIHNYDTASESKGSGISPYPVPVSYLHHDHSKSYR